MASLSVLSVVWDRCILLQSYSTPQALRAQTCVLLEMDQGKDMMGGYDDKLMIPCKTKEASCMML